MTREEILAGYKVDKHNRIRSPGKFEGEPIYAPYFYELWCEGEGEDEYMSDGEDCGELIFTSFDVTEEDRAAFPELAGVNKIQLHESELGFVYVTAV